MTVHRDLKVIEGGRDAAPPLIAARGLGIRRSERWLVQDVDIAVHAGEIVTIIGPNGGGKTTVVRALLGLMEPDAGRIQRAAGLTIGYVPQRFQVPRTLPLPVHRLMTLTRPARRGQVVNGLKETGVAHLIDAPAHTLSGGELQRVLLARALLAQPDLLVLDEPVQGVDFTGEAALYQLIGDIRRTRGCGILLVSHDLHIVMGSTDTVICLNGHVCCTGEPRAVARNKEFVRMFGAEAAETYALYAHAHDHDHDLTGEVLHDHQQGETRGR